MAVEHGPLRDRALTTLSGFSLSKWYLDCVSDAGDVWIGYWALLHWRGAAVRAASVLQVSREGLARTAQGRRGVTAPVREGGVVTWSAPGLGAEGRWDALTPPAVAALLETERGSVVWRCWQPRGRARVTAPDGAIVGLGYVEELELTIAPWRLPIDELRWGRFLSERGGLVWIDWREAERPASTWAFLDGSPVAASIIDENEIVSEDGTRLLLENGRTLRDGTLRTAALSGLAEVARLLPLRFLRSEETKWLRRGRLVDRDGAAAEGWAINERVRFG